MAYFLSPILIAHWPYLKMKNFDFFVQNILDGIKILDLNDAGSYQAKPIHTQSAIAQISYNSIYSIYGPI